MNSPTMLGEGLSHHGALLVGYLLALITWDRIAHRSPALWPASAEPVFEHPWREVGYYGIALAAMIGIGQLYSRHWLLPSRGAAGIALDALNQVLIFSPALALPIIRRQGWDSAWLPMNRVWLRSVIGILLSVIAVLAFTSVRQGSASFVHVIRDVYHPRNLSNFVQVLAEDAALAVLFVRMRAAIGLMRSIIVVAVLFAGAHIPAMLAGSVGVWEIVGLVRDAGLAVVVLYFLQRSGDVWWFCWIHFAMDMMQFYAVPK